MLRDLHGRRTGIADAGSGPYSAGSPGRPDRRRGPDGGHMGSRNPRVVVAGEPDAICRGPSPRGRRVRYGKLPRMRATAADRAASPTNPYLISAVAWLVPGAGHLWLGR